MRRLYSLFMYLAAPFVLGYFAARGFRDTRYWSRWGERLGYAPPSRHSGAVMVHGSSMGEINAAAPLVRALLTDGGADLLITAFTPTGSNRAEELFGQQVAHCYLPLDLPSAVRRFLDRQRPAAVVIMETEVWPNLLHFAAQRGIPVAIVNARLSDRSLRGYRRLGALIREALEGVDLILAQSEDDGARFVQCGADPGRVLVTGNLKFDIGVSASVAETGELLRASWGATRPVLVAGSTHAADESALLEGFSGILVNFPEALLILVPRHPERFGEAAKAARDSGLRTHLLSEGQRLPEGTQCLVVDTMGELLRYYAAADVAFVGGTIAPVGGHNVLEPAALGKPVLVGRDTHNVREAIGRLIGAGAARVAGGADEVETMVSELLADAGLRDRMGRAGRQLVLDGRGALEKTLQALGAVIPKSD